MLLGKNVSSGAAVGNYKMILKHFVAPESKEVLKEYWVYIKKTEQLGAVAKLAKSGTI